MSNSLNQRQLVFIKEYLIDKNATRAAKAAGYSPKTARSQGQRLLTHADIKRELDHQIKKQLKKLDLKSETILKELLRLATVDISKAFDDMGQMKPLHQIPINIRKAISSIEVHEIFDGQGNEKTVIGLAKKLRFWDKTRALELLAKHLNLLKDQDPPVQNNSPVVLVIPSNGREVKD